MAGGIEITARYRIKCDRCEVFAENQDVEYRRLAAALDARERIAKFEGWLLRWDGPFPTQLCPECAADEPVDVGRRF